MDNELQAMQNIIDNLPKQVVSFRTTAKNKLMLDLKCREIKAKPSEIIDEALSMYFNPNKKFADGGQIQQKNDEINNLKITILDLREKLDFANKNSESYKRQAENNGISLHSAKVKNERLSEEMEGLVTQNKALKAGFEELKEKYNELKKNYDYMTGGRTR